MDLYYATAHELSQRIRQREISVEELVLAQFARIAEVDERVHAYLTLNQERAYEKAKELDAAIQSGAAPAPLAGIPVAYKDNICTKNLRTTCASKMLEQYHPPYHATVVERLERAGMVMTGKTNLDEFAMGSSTENSAFGPTYNPWDLTRVPGGSSGGAAAAVAAGEAVVALGSDTGGSIRQPAAFCGIVGLKPTYGLVSRYGLVAFASSLDQIGPLTRDVQDCALVLNMLVGHDPHDATSLLLDPGENPDYSKNLAAGVQGLKIGIPEEYFTGDIDPVVRAAVKQAIKLLTRLGADAEEISLPHTEYALPAYYLIAPAEASSNLARFDGVRYGYRTGVTDGLLEMYCQSRSEGFGSEVKRRIMLGTHVLRSGYYDAYYLKAQKVRTLIQSDFEQAFARCDLLISPTTPTTAFPLGKNTADPLAMYQSDLCTVPANLAGIPALTLPVGFDENGLPIGLQIMGNHFAEGTMLQAAYVLEQELAVWKHHPVISREV